MSDNKKFQDFGGQLKKIRLGANKSINDVSGAVELPVNQLKQIELGEVRPKAELIFLLANYFVLSFEKTQQLLRLAGYTRKGKGDKNKGLHSVLGGLPSQRSEDSQRVLLIVPELNDERTTYINETSVNVSNSGVVIEFLQSATISRDNQAKIIAKVGMSVEHASQLRSILQKALANLKKPENYRNGSDSIDRPGTSYSEQD